MSDEQQRIDQVRRIHEAHRQLQEAMARLRDRLETCSHCSGQGSTFYGKVYKTCDRCGGSGYEPKRDA